jgi:outer membrane protein assembly factor BamB
MARRFACLPVVLSAGVILCAAPLSRGEAAGSEWSTWRGPNRTGVVDEKGWKTDWPAGGPKQVWKASVGLGFSCLSVAGGRVYTMGNAADVDTVFALDSETGKEIWKHSYPCPRDPKYYDEGGPSATPTVEGGRVYTLSKSGHVFCLDAATGKEIWKRNVQEDPGAKPPEWGFAGSPYIDGKKVILNVGAGGLALDKETGAILWKSGNGPGGYSTALPFTVDGQRGVALFVQKAVVGVDPETGKPLWDFPWKTSYDANIADPLVSGNEVFISSGYGTGCALIRIEGGKATEVWKNKNMRNHFSSCVLWQGHIYGVDNDTGKKNAVKCLDWKTGEVKWSQEGLGCGALIVADGKLVILGEKGELVIAEASPAAWKEIARAQILGGKCWTMPVLCGGRVYARSGKGDVVCVALN